MSTASTPQGSPPLSRTLLAQDYYATVIRNPWIPKKQTRLSDGTLWKGPFPRQQHFLHLSPMLEVLYGGAAGGGKSESLLMAAAQYVDVPGYSALLLRKSFRDLSQPDALIPRSKEWWLGTDAKYSGIDHRWTFPGGATITFGYLEHDDDVYQYQGAAFQYVGFDELTQFSEPCYRYLFSRLRKTESMAVPLRMRAGSNPGGRGHEWVKKRFVTGREVGRAFVPARLEDNPALDYGEYIRSLAELDPITRAQLLAGDWDAYEGGRFAKEWFREYRRRGTTTGDVYAFAGRDAPVNACWNFVTVDPACTEKDTADYTAIITFAVVPPARDLLVLDVIREHLAIDRIVPRIADACRKFKPRWVGIESSGFQTAIYDAAKKHPDIPTVCPLFPEGRGKLVRATPAIIRAEAGQIFLPEVAPWKEDFVAELVQFTGVEGEDAHDDQVDALAYAVQQVDEYAPLVMGAAVPNPEPSHLPPLTVPESQDERRTPFMPGERPRRERLFGRGL